MKSRTDHLETREPVLERRRSSRSPCAGELLLYSGDDGNVPIRARLCDISDEGFRATHEGVQLSAGQLLRFKHAQLEGTATLIWTRIVGKRAESGFLIIEMRPSTSKTQ